MRRHCSLLCIVSIISWASLGTAFPISPSRASPTLSTQKGLRLDSTLGSLSRPKQIQPPNHGKEAIHIGRGGSSTSLSSVPWLLATCLGPPLVLGQIRSEFTVSYGYGTAVSASAAYLIWKHVGALDYKLWLFHAASLVFYGVRLNAFLFDRLRKSQRQKDMVRRIEDRATERGGRASRIPFGLSCGLLYYGLIAPLILTKRAFGGTASRTLRIAFGALASAQWFGFSIAALGDHQKTGSKWKNGEDSLVTTGIWSKWRHPNYSGETIAWTANALCGVMGAVSMLALKENSSIGVPEIAGNLCGVLVGWMGIVFVLCNATRNLEKKQREAYGGTDQYKKWVASTWGGWQFPEKKKTADQTKTHHEIKPEIIDEDFGSGI